MGRSLKGLFRSAVGSSEADNLRVRGTRDLARRIGFIRPENVELTKGSTRRVVSFFNPALKVDSKGLVEIHGRAIAGYYKYVSMIARVELSLEDLTSGACRACESRLKAEPEIFPGGWIDFWGAEDPRFTKVEDKEVIVYTGRTLAYYSQTNIGNTFPVVAVRNNGSWSKKGYITLKPDEAPLAVSIKNSFILEHKMDKLAFLRVHDVSGRFHLLVSKIDGIPERDGITPIVVGETWRVIDPAPFEEKVGWASPVVGYSGEGILVLLHGVDTEMQVYRAFAMIIDIEGEDLVVRSVTPTYIMEPKTVEEIYGDRPYTVFPCGSWLVDNEILVSYGSADTAAGLAFIPLSDLMDLLDKGSTGY
ncbi:MAG: hypothetical protein F7B20_03895 [Aeropyrum sp.]|nr:hypothetical protein [Aeropyrum sp.]MCE4616503.1 hypothetical protein [Aeropyrum sp.]